MPSITVAIALGGSQEGALLRAQLVDTAGDDVGVGVITGFVEHGAGAFQWTGTVPDGFQGAVRVEDRTDGTVLAVAAVNPSEVEALEQLLLRVDQHVLALLPAGESGGAPSEFAVVVTADTDYTVAAGRPVDIRSRAWPDLTGAQIRWWALTETGKPILQDTPLVLNAGTAEQTLRLELTAVQTRAIYAASNQVGRHYFDATLADLSVVDLAAGPLRARPAVTA